MASALAVVMLLALPGVAVQSCGRRGWHGGSGGIGVGMSVALPSVGFVCGGGVAARWGGGRWWLHDPLVSWCLGVALPVAAWV